MIPVTELANDLADTDLAFARRLQKNTASLSLNTPHPYSIITTPWLERIHSGQLEKVVQILGCPNLPEECPSLCVCALHTFSPEWQNPPPSRVVNSDGTPVGFVTQTKYPGISAYFLGSPDKGYTPNFIIANNQQK